MVYQPAIAKVFSRHRFLELSKYFHVPDPRTLPEQSDPERKLYRIKPVMEVLALTFQEMYSPHREQAIDKAMVKFKGRVGFLQYMPMKPCKRGIKIWRRRDSTNGYLCQFEVFVGKESSTVERQQEPQPRADRAIATVVRRLTRSLVGKNYFAFMDNFFASVFLFQELLCENIYCCGTVRSNHKGFPAMLKGVNLKEQGDSKFA